MGIVEQTVGLFKQDVEKYVGVSLVGVLLTVVLGALTPPLIALLYEVTLGWLVTFALSTGLIMVALKRRLGQIPAFTDVLLAFRRIDRLIAIWLIKGVLWILGITLILGTGGLGALVIAPIGLYLTISWLFTTHLLLDADMGPLQALGASWALVRGQWFTVFGIGLALVILYMLLSLVPLVGTLAQLLYPGVFACLCVVLYERLNKGLVGRLPT